MRRAVSVPLAVGCLAASLLTVPPSASRASEPSEAAAQEGEAPESAADKPEERTESAEEPSTEAAAPQEEPSLEVETTARAPMEAFVTPRAVNVVDEEELQQKQAQSVTDALDEEPGIFVQSTNRGAGSVFLRGLVGPENVIYFDGVRFNQSTFRTGPNQYLNTMDPWALRRLEVVRGPGSVLYGSGAMGGVIQAFPRSLPDQELQLRGIGFYEVADNTYGGALDTGVRAGDWAVTGGATFRNHGDLRIGQTGGESVIAPGEQNNRVPGSSYEENYFRGATGVDLSERSLLRFNYYGGFVDDATRVDRLGGGEVRLYDNRDDLMYLTYEYDGPPGVDQLQVNASYHRTYERVDRFNCQTEAFEGDESIQVTPDPRGCARRRPDLLVKHRINEDTVQTLGSSLSGVSRLFDRALQISWGADFYQDRVESSRRDATAPEFVFEERDRGNFSDGSRYTEAGVYSHADWRFARTGKSDFFATLGGRLAHFGAFAPDVSDQLGDVSYDFTGVVGSAGIKYLYSTKLNAHLTWNQGFRAPNLQESTVLGNTGNFFEVPNDGLGPERSNTVELGAKLDFPALGRLSASGWVSLIDGKITREPASFDGQQEIDGAPVRRRINADSAYFAGADLSVETASVEGFNLFGYLSAVDGAVESADPQPQFDPGALHGLLSGEGTDWANPRRLPPFSYKLGLEFAPEEHWYARVYAQGAAAQSKLGPGDIDDERICETAPGVLYGDLGESCPGTGGWTTLNLRGGWSPEEFVRFDLAVENLTDLRYKYHGSGPPAPGVNGKLLLTLRNP